ncbi:MAG: hypothetical protein U1E05_05450, partial [Patescibacteria group bacterium]|nr:hypothetical protein [Patescibacteria group bacterium]
DRKPGPDNNGPTTTARQEACVAKSPDGRTTTRQAVSASGMTETGCFALIYRLNSWNSGKWR